MAGDIIYVVGTSGFAREVSDIVAALGHRCVFVAANADERASWVGDDEVILESDLAARAPCRMALGIGDNTVRRTLAGKLAQFGAFPALLHPSASFGRGQREAVEAREGVIVCAGVRMTNAIALGHFSIVNLNATIGHDVIVEPFCNIAPGANISGCVHLGEGVWIGTGAAVNQGSAAKRLAIGAGTMIGSGAVVVKDCDAHSTYVGNPARKLERRP
jgi:sugar O-acyltransferase (sialic acid O-acetyltransferase NeuD family)